MPCLLSRYNSLRVLQFEPWLMGLLRPIKRGFNSSLTLIIILFLIFFIWKVKLTLRHINCKILITILCFKIERKLSNFFLKMSKIILHDRILYLHYFLINMNWNIYTIMTFCYKKRNSQHPNEKNLTSRIYFIPKCLLNKLNRGEIKIIKKNCQKIYQVIQQTLK